MARDIPIDQPLTREDRKYLRDRGMYGLEERIDTSYPPAPGEKEALEQEATQEQGGDGSVALLTAETEDLRRRNAEMEAELTRFREQAAMADQPTDTGEAAEDEDEVPPYSEWRLEDLQSEAGKRSLSKSGTKAEIAARLEADDAANA